jgi:hypothetical protein
MSGIAVEHTGQTGGNQLDGGIRGRFPQVMIDERCQHGNDTPIVALARLHDSQAGAGRHKCPNCAYQQGFQWGLTHDDFPTADLETCQIGLTAPRSVLSTLPVSQGGTGRHKCTVCAFNFGFEAAQTKSNPAPKKTAPSKEPVLVIGTLKQREPPKFGKIAVHKKQTFRGRKGVNYRAQAKENEAIGEAGEALVAKWERELLLKAGKPDLAKKVEVVANTQGDGLGYDVLSFTPTGEEKFIEVKATTGPAESPFFLTANELSFSQQNPTQFHLFRVYNYDRAKGSAEFYSVSGDIDAAFNLVPVEYRVMRC